VYDAHAAAVTTLRSSIASAALPMNLAKIFSSSPCLPIGMDAADWVANMTNTDSAVNVAAAVATSSPGGVHTTSTPTSKHLAAEKAGGGTNIGHASLIYTIPGVGVAASLNKPAQVQGYLRMQTKDGKGWKRRWHVLEKGQFFYLRESAFLAPRLVVNVLTCGARPCLKSDMDCVFELISPTRTLLYQAESELDLKTWVSVFANSTEYLLSLQSTRNDTEALERHMDVKIIAGVKQMKAGLLARLRKENPHCAECHTSSPDWISISLGVMVCIVCSGIHRSLGVHISKVRSIVLDDLEPELLDMMCALGNNRVNAIYEATLQTKTAAAGAAATTHAAGTHGHHAQPAKAAAGSVAATEQSGGGIVKPLPGAPREAKEEFIRAKYVERRFLSPTVLAAASAAASVPDGAAPSLELYSGWFKAVEQDDLEGLLVHLLTGCDPDWRNPEQPRHPSALHHAATHDAVLALEFLMQNGADAGIEDDDGRTPLDYARAADSKRVVQRLQGQATSNSRKSSAHVTSSTITHGGVSPAAAASPGSPPPAAAAAAHPAGSPH